MLLRYHQNGWKKLTGEDVLKSKSSDVLPDGVGKVGELVAYADDNQVAKTAVVGLTEDEGDGVSISTSVGDMSITGVYVFDGGGGGNVVAAAVVDRVICSRTCGKRRINDRTTKAWAT